MGGRLENADIPQSTKYPILLNQSHHVTLLIVCECHETVKHGGVKETLTELFIKYCMDVSFVRSSMEHLCTNSLPPPLPSFRVSEAPPFAYTVDLDFARPIYIRGAEKSKVWICLFTCCIVRAIHLEIVSELRAQA